MTSHSEWLQQRRRGLGGSDIAAILGISPWKTAYQVWLDKTQPLRPEKEDTEAQELGKAYESAILDIYAKRTGYTLERRGNEVTFDPEVSYFFGSFDAVALVAESPHEGDIVVDAKNVDASKADQWGRDGSDVCPEDIAVQGLWYCGVGGFKQCDFAAAIGNRSVRIISIPRDDEVIEWLRDEAYHFWQDHVLTGIPPKIDTAHRTAGDIVTRAHNVISKFEEPTKIAATSHVQRMLQEYYTGQVMESVGQKMKKRAKAELQLAVGPNAEAVTRIDDHVFGFTQKWVKKDPYEVPATAYIDFRVKAPKGMKPMLEEAEALLETLAAAGIDQRLIAAGKTEEESE